jgi:hypothetical protein
MGLCFCLVYREVRRWTYASVVADAFAYYGLQCELATRCLLAVTGFAVATAGHALMAYVRAVWLGMM